MTTALLQTTYFGPVQWYQKLASYDQCLIEQHDTYHKQSYRNRCIIATANGQQVLTVPVETAYERQEVKDVRISDHNQWRRIHWNALQSAYSESPFYDYYADDIRPFFQQRYTYLIDFNEAIRRKICELIDIHPNVDYTTEYMPISSTSIDFRDVINAKHPQQDDSFYAKKYYQVFEQKHGFQPNLSILDLLFCMGPEAVFYLQES